MDKTAHTCTLATLLDSPLRSTTGKQSASAQHWLIGCLLFNSIAIADPYIYTYIDGQPVAEFGDFGKAANQYSLKVGDLNVISSVIVTRGSVYLIDDSFAPSSNESSSMPEGVPEGMSPSSQNPPTENHVEAKTGSHK